MAAQERQVEAHVVTQDGSIAHELGQVGFHGFDRWGFQHHLVGDAGQLGDKRRDAPPRVDQGRPFAFHPAVVKLAPHRFR